MTGYTQPGWCAAVASLAILLAATGVAQEPPLPDPGPPPFAVEHGLPRHVGTYEPARILWDPDPRLADVRGVFPHPARGSQVFAVTAAGVWRSDDEGVSWRRLDALRAERIGTVLDVAFRPPFPNTLYLASAESGIWRSEDLGESAVRIGTREHGMAADETVGVCLYPADPTYRTLLVCHGQHPGVSRSEDDGKTWSILLPERCVHRIVAGRGGVRDLYALAAHRNDREVIGLYHLGSPGQYPRELVRDILPTDVAVPLEGPHGVVLSTVDSGLIEVTRGGAGLERIGPASSEWAAVACAWGPHVDSQTLWAYEPLSRGVIVSQDRLRTHTMANDGLYRGSLVREGARLRANPGATALYAAVNGILYVGRNAAPLRIETVQVNPCVFTIEEAVFSGRRWEDIRRLLDDLRRRPRLAGELDDILTKLDRLDAGIPDAEIRVTARVHGPDEDPVSGVTVDLSRVGGTPRTPMHDDGRHGDGEAVDGVFGTAFRLTRSGLRRREMEWRTVHPGRMGLTVSAVTSGGKMAAAVGALAVYMRPDTFTFYSEREDVRLGEPEGTVSAKVIRDPDLAFAEEHCLAIEAGPGAWTAPLGNDYLAHNVTGYHALSFLIRADDATAADELRVSLRDNPEYTFPTTTDPVDVVRGHYIPGEQHLPSQRYARVILPLDRLIGDDTRFLPDLLAWVVVSGETTASRRYFLDCIRFYLTREDLQRDMEEQGR